MDSLDSSTHHHVNMQLLLPNPLVHKKDSKIEFLLEAFHLPYGNFHIYDEFEEYTVFDKNTVLLLTAMMV